MANTKDHGEIEDLKTQHAERMETDQSYAWAVERGLRAEEKFEDALKTLQEFGVLRYKRSERFSDKDRVGIDFEIWGIDEFDGCYFTVDVTASWRKAMDKAHISGYFPSRNNHHIYTLREENPKIILHYVIELFSYESGADKARLERMVGLQ